MRKPHVFIGSSTESKALAHALQLGLDGDTAAFVWDQDQFRLSESPIESLERIGSQVDFAVLVVTADDVRETRGERHGSPRDNIVFEAGFFVGRLGRGRTFLVQPRGDAVRLPSDLAGVTAAGYETGGANLQVMLGPACTRIKAAIAELGPLRSAKPAPGALKPNRGRVPRPRRQRSLGRVRAQQTVGDMRIANISASGALLECSEPIDVGTTLDLELELDNNALVRARSTVVRIQYPDWMQVGGVGVRFEHGSMDAASRAALESFVEPTMEDPIA